MLYLAHVPLVEKSFDVDIWLCRYDGDRQHVEKLCALRTELLEWWRGSYMVNLDALCWLRDILPALLRYMDHMEYP